MAKKRSEQLREAMQQKIFVRFTSPFEDGYSRGYVLDVGKDFFVLLTTDETCRFNGFQCIRIKDVRNLREDPYSDFAVAALQARKQSVSKKPNVKLGSIAEMLLSISEISSLVTIHRHKIKPDSCWIGKLVGVNDLELSLLEIGPEAKWDTKWTKYKLKDISQVDFGGGYEEALFLVAGNPPKFKAKG
jgi:hypothetical protein